jgi:hypothetical protein
MFKNTKIDKLFRKKADKLLANILKNYVKEAEELISQVETALLYNKDPYYQDDSVKKMMKEIIQNIKSLSFKITNAKNEHGCDLKSNLCFEMEEKLGKLALLCASTKNSN